MDRESRENETKRDKGREDKTDGVQKLEEREVLTFYVHFVFIQTAKV